MGRYLNSSVPFEVYKEIAGTRFFVDKSLLLDDVLSTMEIDGQKYLCITRPRRFGKSVMAAMVAAFFGKAVDAGILFERLAIAGSENFKVHLNKHNVIYIDFSEVPRDCTNYRQYIARIQDGINNDLARVYDEIFFYVKNNIDDIRDDLILMIAGEGVEAEIRNYAAVSMELNTKDEIYSAMVIYGLLTYMDGEVLIPNKELMDKFKEFLMSKESMGYVYRLANESKRMLAATLRGDTEVMAEILEFAHNTESPVFSYNSEIELSAVVNLVYLAARDKYRVEREDKAGKGYVDFIFYPEGKTGDALILELKVDSTPEEAIRQIREKDYVLRFKGKMGEKEKYTGRILAVGISYSTRTKEHFCKVEVL